MKKFTEFNDLEKARKFQYVLKTENINSELRSEVEPISHDIWIYNDEDFDRAEEILDDFDNIEKTLTVSTTPSPLKALNKLRASNKPQRIESTTSVTLIVIALSIIFTLISKSPNLLFITRKLYFSEYMAFRNMPEIMSGEVWRLITPIFIHGDLFHLIFNMMWFWDFGNLIEHNDGRKTLKWLIIVIGILCNISQYFVSGPYFIGLSGVVYGLFGYIYIMSRYKISSGYRLEQSTAVILIGWMIFCILGNVFGFMLNVANTQHVVGLVVGALIAAFRSNAFKTISRQMKYKNNQKR